MPIALSVFAAGGRAAWTVANVVAVAYDNRVGFPADAAGIPDLPLHGSATRVWYHPTSGNNANSGVSTSGSLTLSQMKATIGGGSGAWQALRSGFGDHLMVPAGVTVAEQLPSLAARTGLSTSYPIVITTYDPSDPTNSALWRTGQFTLDVRDPTADGPTGGGDEALRMNAGSINRVVWENVRFYQPQVVDEALYKHAMIMIAGDGAGSGTVDFDCSILFHNCTFDGTQITTQYTGIEFPTEKHYLQNVVFRHCAWVDSPGQGAYAVWQDGYTVEDCIFWHSGFSRDGTRDTATLPAVIYNHNVYHDCEGLNTLYRRCVFAEGSLHGLMLRCGGQVDDCIFLENPLSILAGGGVGYNKHRPLGVPFQSTGVICLDGVNCNTEYPEGGALNTSNCQSGSFFADAIAAHRTQSPNYNQFAALIHTRNADGHALNPGENQFDPTGPAPADSYMEWRDCLVFDWTPGDGHATLTAQIAANQTSSELAQCHVASNNNKWAGDAHMGGSTYGSGNSTSIGSVPNSSFDTAALATALGYGSKALMYAAMIAAPKTHWARSASNLIRAAYGKSLRF